MRRKSEAGRRGGLGVEWDALRALLAREARTPMGRDRALAAEPLTGVARVLSALRATSEARAAAAVGGEPPLPPLPDIRPVLARCRAAGTALDGGELAQILLTL